MTSNAEPITFDCPVCHEHLATRAELLGHVNSYVPDSPTDTLAERLRLAYAAVETGTAVSEHIHLTPYVILPDERKLKWRVMAMTAWDHHCRLP